MATVQTGIATDLITFSRTSNATVTDSDGKIKWAPHNLLLASEQFESSNWSKVATTVTANATTAPNGTNTADSLLDTAVNNIHYAAQDITSYALSGRDVVVRIFAKKNTLDYMTLGVSDISSGTLYAVAVFNLATGALATSGASGTGYAVVGTPTISSVGDGWYYCSVTCTIGTSVSFLRAVSAPNKTGVITASAGGYESYLGNGSGIYIWGAHLYRSDLGGMVQNPAQPAGFGTYYPTTPKNLLGFTESYGSGTGWTLAGIKAIGSGSVANATTSPNGLLSASLLVEDTGTSGHNIYRTFANAINTTPYTWTAYVKPAGRSIVQLVNQATSVVYTAEYSLAGGGTVTNRSGTGTATIVALADGWYRISATAVATASGTGYWQLNFCNAPSVTSYTGDGISGIYLWGAQLSDSASIDPYVPNYGAAPTAAAYYGPRLDFDGATLAAKGLLVEEQRTNLALASNAPTMGTGLSSTANAAISPDGTMSAVRVSKTDATTPRYFPTATNMTTVGGRKYVISRYFKYDGYDVDVSLEYNSTVNWDLSWTAIFAVRSTGVTVSSDSNTVSSVHNVGNGWYRAITTFTAGAAPSVTANPVFLTRVTGASGVSVLVYGGMAEENASFATSYIPTGAATVTRAADVVSVSTSQFPYSETAGSWVVNFQTQVSGAVPTTVYILGLNNDQNKRIAYIGSGASAAASYDGVTIVGTSEDVTGPVSKFASAYDATGRAVVANGTSVTTGTVVAGYSVGSFVNIAQNSGAFTTGWVRQITYIPRRLSNTELQARTV
jgi:hypothetical protein